jgi:hypothetical protein
MEPRQPLLLMTSALLRWLFAEEGGAEIRDDALLGFPAEVPRVRRVCAQAP